MEEYLDIVDENGNLTGEKELRSVVHEKGLWHRTVHVYFFRKVLDKIEFLVHLRLKSHTWDVCFGGHVESRQTIEETATKEVFEEVGLKISTDDLALGSQRKYDGGNNKEIIQSYYYNFVDDIITLTFNDGSVLEVKWMSLNDIRNSIKNETDSWSSSKYGFENAVDDILNMNKYKTIIADAALGDEIGISNVTKKTWLATYENEEYGITKDDILSKDFDSEKKLQAWRETIISNGLGNSYVVVVKQNDKVVGFCSAIKGIERNELGAFYVLPDFQGQGIGKQLLAKCLDWLGKEKTIILQVASFNAKTIEFYNKFGFTVVDKPILFKELPNGKKFPLIEMELIY